MAWFKQGDYQHVVAMDKRRALECFLQCEPIFRKLVQKDLNHDLYWLHFAYTMDRIGEMNSVLSEIVSASRAYHEGLAFRRRLLLEKPDNLRVREQLAYSLHWTGEMKGHLGSFLEGLTLIRESIQMRQAMVEATPGALQPKRELGYSYRGLGEVELLAGNQDSGAVSINKCLAHCNQLLKDFSESHIELLADKLEPLASLINLHTRLGNRDEVVRLTQECIETHWQRHRLLTGNSYHPPRVVELWRELGDYHLQEGALPQARECYVKSLEVLHELPMGDVVAQKKLLQARLDLCQDTGRPGHQPRLELLRAERVSCFTLIRIATVLLRNKDVENTMRCAEKLAAPAHEPGAQLEAAKLYARIAREAPAAESVTTCELRCLQLLNGLVERNYLALPRLEAETVFERLEGHEEYSKIKSLAANRLPLFTQLKDTW